MKRITGVVIVVCFLGFEGCGLCNVLPPPEREGLPFLPAPVPPKGQRIMIFVSDLHLGVGREPATTKWHNMEDFRWHKEFDDFLHWANASGKQQVDLVFVGDTFELWQSLSKDCDHSLIDKNLGCTEQEALNRVRRVIKEHKEFFETVAWFADKDDNRVTLIPGNHDIALMFPSVQKAVIDAFPTGKRNVRIAAEGYWLSADGEVYAEHGQQIGRDPNKFKGWPLEPFWKGKRTRYLDQPWGEQFVQELYNEYEIEYPIIDNLSEEIEGLRYAMKAGGFQKVTEALGKAVLFALTQTSWRQTKGILGETGIPSWNVEAIRSQPKEKQNRFLIESLPLDDPLRHALEESLRNNQPVPIPSELSQEEIVTICNRRWAYRKGVSDNSVEECPSNGQTGYIVQNIVEAIDKEAKTERYRKHLRTVKDLLPSTTRPTSQFSLYIYGHTHKRENNYQAFQPGEPWKPVIYNDGAWQRTATPQEFCAIATAKNIPLERAIKVISLEDLPPCYPFLWVYQKQDGGYGVDTLYWVQPSNHQGSHSVSCPYPPHIPPSCQ